MQDVFLMNCENRTASFLCLFMGALHVPTPKIIGLVISKAFFL